MFDFPLMAAVLAVSLLILAYIVFIRPAMSGWRNQLAYSAHQRRQQRHSQTLDRLAKAELRASYKRVPGRAFAGIN